MTVDTLVFTQPRSFVPPGDRSVRLAHLDPRPLYREDAPVASPWRSPSFWLAWALVMPVAVVARSVRSWQWDTRTGQEAE